MQYCWIKSKFNATKIRPINRGAFGCGNLNFALYLQRNYKYISEQEQGWPILLLLALSFLGEKMRELITLILDKNCHEKMKYEKNKTGMSLDSLTTINLYKYCVEAIMYILKGEEYTGHNISHKHIKTRGVVIVNLGIFSELLLAVKDLFEKMKYAEFSTIKKNSKFFPTIVRMVSEMAAYNHVVRYDEGDVFLEFLKKAIDFDVRVPMREGIYKSFVEKKDIINVQKEVMTSIYGKFELGEYEVPCSCCKKILDITAKVGESNSATIDHIVSRGYPAPAHMADQFAVLSCKTCNSKYNNSTNLIQRLKILLPIVTKTNKMLKNKSMQMHGNYNSACIKYAEEKVNDPFICDILNFKLKTRDSSIIQKIGINNPYDNHTNAARGSIQRRYGISFRNNSFIIKKSEVTGLGKKQETLLQNIIRKNSHKNISVEETITLAKEKLAKYEQGDEYIIPCFK